MTQPNKNDRNNPQQGTQTCSTSGQTEQCQTTDKNRDQHKDQGFSEKNEKKQHAEMGGGTRSDDVNRGAGSREDVGHSEHEKKKAGATAEKESQSANQNQQNAPKKEHSASSSGK
jgi:hypothetical protein